MSRIIRLALLTLLVAATGLFNVGLVDVRLEEVQYHIGKIAEDQNASQTFGIVARYELIKRRKQYGEENLQNFELEAKVAALSSGEQSDRQARRTARDYLLIPIRLSLNLIRASVGEPPINPLQENRVLKALEIGYFWERNRKYNEAVKIYNDVLKRSDVTPEVRAAVMAHKAFCFSMLGDYAAAKSTFENIIALFPTTQAGGLSWKLLDFLEGMEQDRVALEQQQLSSFDRAKQYYLLMDYRNAIKYFSTFLSENPPEDRVMEARFYKGRAHEEVGETEEATAEYGQVMRNDATREWAKQANRRMVMLGEFYEQKKQMADEARKQLAAYQDEAFMNRISQMSKLVGESSLRKELMAGVQEEAAVASAPGSDSVLDLINRIGALDLTGEQEKKRKEEIEKIRENLIAQGKVSQTEMKELERVQALNENQFRKPSTIRRDINEYATQLKYRYNKLLRSGTRSEGRIDVEFRIAPSGKVSSARVIRSTMRDGQFEKEVTDQILGWTFQPVPDSLGELTVNYPFEFTEEN